MCWGLGFRDCLWSKGGKKGARSSEELRPKEETKKAHKTPISPNE